MSNLKSHVQAKYECIRISCENCDYNFWSSKEHQFIKVNILVSNVIIRQHKWVVLRYTKSKVTKVSFFLVIVVISQYKLVYWRYRIQDTECAWTLGISACRWTSTDVDDPGPGQPRQASKNQLYCKRWNSKVKNEMWKVWVQVCEKWSLKRHQHENSYHDLLTLLWWVHH